MAIFDKGIKSLLKRDKPKSSNKLQRIPSDEKEVAIVTPGVRPGLFKRKYETEAKLPELPSPPPAPLQLYPQNHQIVPWQQYQQHQPEEPNSPAHPVSVSMAVHHAQAMSPPSQPVSYSGPLVPMQHPSAVVHHPDPPQYYQHNTAQYPHDQNTYLAQPPPQPLSPKLAFTSIILQPLLINHPYLLMLCLVTISMCSLYLTLNSVVSIAPLVDAMLRTIMRCACFVAVVYAVAISMRGYFGLQVIKHDTEVSALRELTDAARDGVIFTAMPDSFALQKENRRQVKAIEGTNKTKVRKNSWISATYEVEEVN